MTLSEFIKTYKGKAKFDVDTLEDGESKDTIVCMNDEIEAVKDDLLSADVVRYAVTAFTANIPTIGVVVKKKEIAQEPETVEPEVTETEEQEP